MVVRSSNPTRTGIPFSGGKSTSGTLHYVLAQKHPTINTYFNHKIKSNGFSCDFKSIENPIIHCR
jgi:hypothetical protein